MNSADLNRAHSSNTLIGRTRDYSRLHDACFNASIGKGGFLLLEAESGLGKSLLLDQLQQQNAEKELFFLRGQGVTLNASKPLDIFSGCSRDIAHHMKHHPAFRARILQELELSERRIISKVLPELADALDVPRHSYADLIPHGNWVTLSTLSHLIDILGSPAAPAIIILDDCHWADRLSLTLLQHWLEHNRKNTTSSCHTLVIAAARKEELDEHHLLREVPAIDHIELQPLTLNETDELISASLGPHSEAVTSTIYNISRGNPFLAQSIIQNLHESDSLKCPAGEWTLEKEERTALPSTSHTLSFLKKRFEHLDAESVHLFEAAAILGKEFTLKHLLHIHEVDETSLTKYISDAEHRHLIMKISDECYMFTHDKLREALLEMIDVDAQKKVHLRIARMYEEQAEKSAYDIAYHFDAAGEAAIAVQYAVQAALEALETHALEAAEEQYRIALKGCEQLGQDQQLDIKIGLGKILLLTGKYHEAEKLFLEAIQLTEDTLLAAQLEMYIGEIHFKRGQYSLSVDTYKSGLGRLGEKLPEGKLHLWLLLLRECGKHIVNGWLKPILSRKPLPALSEKERLMHQLYVRLSYVAYFHFPIDLTVYNHFSALNIAESRSTSVELSQSLACHGMALSLFPGMPTSEYYGKRALSLQSEIQSLWHKGQALHMMGDVYYAASKHALAIDACSEAVQIFRNTGDLWEMNIAKSNVAYALYRTGNLHEAAIVGEECFHAADNISDITAAASSLAVWARAKSGDIPKEYIRKYISITETMKRQPYTETLTALALSQLRDGDIEGAHASTTIAFQNAGKLLFPAEYVFSSLPWYLTTSRLQLGDFLSGQQAPLRLMLQTRYILLRSYFLKNSLPHVLREYALLLAMSGKKTKSLRYLKKSMQAAREQNAQYEYAQSLLCFHKLSDTDPALKQSSIQNTLELISKCSEDMTILRTLGFITCEEHAEKEKKRESERIELQQAM